MGRASGGDYIHPPAPQPALDRGEDIMRSGHVAKPFVAPSRAARAALALLALGCGGGHAGAPDGPGDAAADGDGAAAPMCMLGVSPVTASTACAAHPELCGVACGDTCVDLAKDGDNCGRCGNRCAPRAACDKGVCGVEPTTLVPGAPGCRSLRLAHEAGAITWSDLGHGTINRISTAGGPVTVLAANVRPAAIHVSSAQPLAVNEEPVGTNVLVRDGAAIWIGADDDVTIDAAGIPRGGGGTAIWSVRAGGQPQALLPAALAPGPSPVSSVAPPGGDPPLEDPAGKPPLSALALSPDGQTLYFGAGTRVYAIPSVGAATADDVKLVAATAGPELGFVTALATDGKRLFFPSGNSKGIYMFDLTGPCAAPAAPDGGAPEVDAASAYECPSFVFGTFPIPLLDTVTIAHGFFAWAKENNVWRADLSEAAPEIDGHVIFSDTILGFGITGFAIGPTTAYFGESTLVEAGGFTSVQVGNPPPARVLARGQSWPSSMLADGQRIYWTTTACDIAFIADAPQ
jgi:hypothetical protein